MRVSTLHVQKPRVQVLLGKFLRAFCTKCAATQRTLKVKLGEILTNQGLRFSSNVWIVPFQITEK